MRKKDGFLLNVYLIINSLLEANDHIEFLGGELEFLRRLFDATVPVDHVQQAVLGVAEGEGCFFLEILSF